MAAAFERQLSESHGADLTAFDLDHPHLTFEHWDTNQDGQLQSA